MKKIALAGPVTLQSHIPKFNFSFIAQELAFIFPYKAKGVLSVFRKE